MNISRPTLLLSLCVALPLAACSQQTNDDPAQTMTPQTASGTQASSEASQSNDVEQLVAHIEQTLPFDASAFTQGLEVDGDSLLVGTGMEGESRVFRYTPGGQAQDIHDIDPDLFGEGITRSGDTVWQLTWRNEVAFKRDATTLAEVDRVAYTGEGWGLCAFDNVLVRSDGTGTLHLHNPDTFAEEGQVYVNYPGSQADLLNELECVTSDRGREVYANVFTTTDILRISLDDAARTAEVTARIDASNVPNNATPNPNHVLNGIAAIPDAPGHFYITGKRWPDLYEVTFQPANTLR